MAENFIQLRVSKNGGYTWSNWKARSLGDTGDFITPAIWRRLGTSRHFVFDFRMDTPADLIASSILGLDGTWQAAPVVGGAYADNARPWSFQDTVNWIPVRIERPNGRTDWKLKGAPGYRLFANVGTGPIRGVRDVEGKLFVVSGTELYRVNRDTTSELLGTIPGEGRVSLTHNQENGGNKVVIANGSLAYTYDTVTGGFAIIDDEGFPGALTVEYLDQYILGIEPQRRFAFHSELADARSYDTTDRFESESSPDRLLGQLVDHGQWWLFGERTIDVYANTGAATGTFQRIGGSTIDRGLAGTYALAKLDNTVWWVADDGSVYRANGYTPERVSTHPIEQALRACDLSKAFCTVYEDEGHKILYITCPDGQTFGFDVASQEWHRRQSFGLTRWNIATLTKWLGVWIAGDYEAGKLYQVDWGFKTEAGKPLICQRTTGVLHGEEEKVTVHGVRVVVDSGRTEQEPRGPGGVVDPLILFNPLPETYEGIPVIHSYRSAGGVRPHVFSIFAGALPTGLSMDSEGLVTGTPTADGEYAWIVRVTDARGFTADLPQGESVGPPVIDGGGIYNVFIAPPLLASQARSYTGTAPSLALGPEMNMGSTVDIVALSPNGLYCVGADRNGTISQIRVVKFNPLTNAWADIGTLPGFSSGQFIEQMRWHPGSRYLAVTFTAAPGVIVFRRDGDTFTRLADPAEPLTTGGALTGGRALCWDSEGERLFAGTNGGIEVGSLYDFVGEVLVNKRDVASPGLNATGGQPISACFANGQGSRYVFLGNPTHTAMLRLSDDPMEIAAIVATDAEAGVFVDASGGYLIAVGDGAVRVYEIVESVIDAEELNLESTYTAGIPAQAFDADISPGRDYIAIAPASGGQQFPTMVSVSSATPPVIGAVANPVSSGFVVTNVRFRGV